MVTTFIGCGPMTTDIRVLIYEAGYVGTGGGCLCSVDGVGTMTQQIVTHQLELSEHRTPPDVQVCARLFLARGARPDDLIEVRRYGQFVRVALLYIAATRS